MPDLKSVSYNRMNEETFDKMTRVPGEWYWVEKPNDEYDIYFGDEKLNNSKEIEEMQSNSVAIGDVLGATIELEANTALIKWTDPADKVLDEVTLAEWNGTLVVRKEGSAPENEYDEIIILDSKTKNAYSSTPLQDTNLEYGKTYYYRFFPYTKMGKYTYGTNLSVTPTRTVISNMPTQNGTLEYTGSELTCTFNNYDSSQLDVSGNTGTNVGSYTATFTPKNGYCWSDNTIEGKTVTWTITEQPITTVPSQSNTLTYDTTEKSVQWSNFDSDKLDISGTQSATNAGSYEVTFTPKTNYKWNDDSANKVVTWTIGKAQGSFTLSDTEITLDADNTSTTVTISVVGDGIISISNSDSTVASAVLDNDKRSITISSPSEENGETVITVSLSGTDNYLSAENYSITVTCDFVVLGSWENASDAEIVSMVQATDNGTLDLTKYWAIGDERIFLLSKMDSTSINGLDEINPEQRVCFVIMHEGEYKDINNKEVNFIIGMKNALSKKGPMNLSGTNINGWDACPRRTWCNEIFYNAIPTTIRPIFKKFKVNSGNKTGTLIETEDYIALFAEKEVYGVLKYSPTQEESLIFIDYFSTSEDHKLNSNGAVDVQFQGSGNWWWLRSMYKDNDTHFCAVNNPGWVTYEDASKHTEDYGGGILVFGCI